MNTEIPLHTPLLFEPIIHEKIWGGDLLYRLLGKGQPTQEKAGESWELSDNDTVQSRISQGPYAGQSFRELFSQHREWILGVQAGENWKRFPLLYKFIHAREALSVQVHPGVGSPYGDAKTECWLVVQAPENARIIVGVEGVGPRSNPKPWPS